jgi:hypothetical protein
MSRALPAAIGTLWIGVALGTAAWAQQPTPYDPSSISSSPLIEQMLARPTTGGFIELTGHVGPSTPETVRLFWDLSLTRYWEIPRSEIVQFVPGNGPNDPVKLYVSAASSLIAANRLVAEQAVMQRTVIERLRGTSMTGQLQSRPELDLPALSYCLEYAVLCAWGHIYACAGALGCSAAAGLHGITHPSR